MRIAPRQLVGLGYVIHHRGVMPANVRYLLWFEISIIIQRSTERDLYLPGPLKSSVRFLPRKSLPDITF